MQVKLEHIIEESVCQVGYLPELYKDAQSEKYKILWCSKVHLLTTHFTFV